MRLPNVPGVCWSIGLGLDTSLPMVCAASVPRAVDQLLITDPTCGVEGTAGDVESWLMLSKVRILDRHTSRNSP